MLNIDKDLYSHELFYSKALISFDSHYKVAHSLLHNIDKMRQIPSLEKAM